jgi:hypothetical protein
MNGQGVPVRLSCAIKGFGVPGLVLPAGFPAAHANAADQPSAQTRLFRVVGKIVDGIEYAQGFSHFMPYSNLYPGTFMWCM